MRGRGVVRPAAATHQDARHLPAELLSRDLGAGRVLRLAEPQEYAEVGRVLQAAFTRDFAVTEWYLEHLAQIAERSRTSHVWVVAGADGILGAVLTPKPQYHRDGAFTFNILGVGPRGRGLDLGRALVGHCVALARALGYRLVAIHSGPQMIAAHRLYVRYGFVRRPERETAVVDGGQRLLVFTYRIIDPVPRPLIPAEEPPSRWAFDETPEEPAMDLSRHRPPGTHDGTGDYRPDPPRRPGRPTLDPSGSYRLSVAPDALRGRAVLAARRLAGAESFIDVIPDPGALTPELSDACGGLVSDDWRWLPRAVLATTPAGRTHDPVEWREEIDTLGLLIHADLVDGLERAIFAESPTVAEVAERLVYARLGDLDQRLATRRFLVGERITAVDLDLFAVLIGLDLEYRAHLGWGAASLVDYPHLWAYARRLLATEGVVDDDELVAAGLRPGADGTYATPWGDPPPVDGVADLRAAWFERPVESSAARAPAR